MTSVRVVYGIALIGRSSNADREDADSDESEEIIWEKFTLTRGIYSYEITEPDRMSKPVLAEDGENLMVVGVTIAETEAQHMGYMPMPMVEEAHGETFAAFIARNPHLRRHPAGLHIITERE